MIELRIAKDTVSVFFVICGKGQSIWLAFLPSGGKSASWISNHPVLNDCERLLYTLHRCLMQKQ
jgi:hypothetical protein